MAPSSSPLLRQGMIVWAMGVDPNGFPKKRPWIIVTATDDILLNEPFVCVAVTTRLSEPLPATYVLLPWERQGRTCTALRKPCAVVCDWLNAFRTSEVEFSGGWVPLKTMLVILHKINELKP